MTRKIIILCLLISVWFAPNHAIASNGEDQRWEGYVDRVKTELIYDSSLSDIEKDIWLEIGIESFKKTLESRIPPELAMEVFHISLHYGWDVWKYRRLNEAIVHGRDFGLKPEKFATYMIVTLVQERGTTDEVFQEAMDYLLRKEISGGYPRPETTKGANPFSQKEIDLAALDGTIRSFLGTRYRYGGETRGGIDCSAFVRRVFAEHGILLPRTSVGQYGVGSRISPLDLKYGDLVFFTKGGRRINHVGIYLGDGMFVHASPEKGVDVSWLGEKFYRTHFIGARRVIPRDDQRS